MDWLRVNPVEFGKPSFGIIWTQKIDKGIANVAAVVHVHPVALGEVAITGGFDVARDR